MPSIKVSELSTAVTPYDGSEYSLGIQDGRSVKVPVPNLAGALGATLIGITPSGTISANTVAGALNELDLEKASGDSVSLKANSADLAATTGAGLVGFQQTGVGAVARTVDDKLKEELSVKDYTTSLEYYNTVNSITPSFWTDDTPPADVVAIPNRLWVGDAVKQNGAYSPEAYKSWVGYSASGYLTYFDSRSQMGVYSSSGKVAIAAATRTSDRGETGGPTIGVSSYANNNSTTETAARAWAYYGHAANAQPNSSTFVAELAVCSTQPHQFVTPYVTGYGNTTACIWAAVGGETAEALIANGEGATLTNVSAGLCIVNSSYSAADNRFNKGIVVGATAVQGTDGTTGFGTAISLARGHTIDWMCPGNNGLDRGAYITSSSTVSTGFGINFQNSGIYFNSNSRLAISMEAGSGTPANYIRLYPASAGNSPVFGVGGSDTNVDLTLGTKGTGVIKLGYAATTADTPASFSATKRIEIKDSAGTVYYIAASTTTW